MFSIWTVPSQDDKGSEHKPPGQRQPLVQSHLTPLQCSAVDCVGPLGKPVMKKMQI